jgi:hypothetical protein
VRNIPQLFNEATCIAIAIYNVAVLGIIIIIITKLVIDAFNVVVLFQSIGMLIVLTVTLCVLFGSKLKLIYFVSNASNNEVTFTNVTIDLPATDDGVKRSMTYMSSQRKPTSGMDATAAVYSRSNKTSTPTISQKDKSKTIHPVRPNIIWNTRAKLTQKSTFPYYNKILLFLLIIFTISIIIIIIIFIIITVMTVYVLL